VGDRWQTPNVEYFLKKRGTDLNLMRIREKTKKLKESEPNTSKYILFIDLKNAYDKVMHRRLFMKLNAIGLDQDIINTIQKLYSQAGVKTDFLNEKIHVNNGVLQGSIISPMLFNIYINDLIENLEGKAYETLAYADDLAIICKDKESLQEVMRTIEAWSEFNGISVNKKKSGILIIDGYDSARDICGFPVVLKYKYLGVSLDTNLNCISHIANIKGKLDKYLRKTFMLNMNYFSVKSILQIFDYYHKSRLLYGMSCFVDKKTPMIKLGSAFFGGLKGILRLHKRCETDRLQLTLGLPELSTYLLNRTVRNLDKYRRIFGERCTLYDKVLEGKCLNADASVIKTGENLGIRIGVGFRQHLKEEVYQWYVSSDHFLVRYFCNSGFFSESFMENCQHCGDPNSREHAVDECVWYEDQRSKLMKVIGEVDRKPSELIEKRYFRPDTGCEKKIKVKKLNAIKKYIRSLYTDQQKEEKENL
jgi:hypothetical protein